MTINATQPLIPERSIRDSFAQTAASAPTSPTATTNGPAPTRPSLQGVPRFSPSPDGQRVQIQSRYFYENCLRKNGVEITGFLAKPATFDGITFPKNTWIRIFNGKLEKACTYSVAVINGIACPPRTVFLVDRSNGTITIDSAVSIRRQNLWWDQTLRLNLATKHIMNGRLTSSLEITSGTIPSGSLVTFDADENVASVILPDSAIFDDIMFSAYIYMKPTDDDLDYLVGSGIPVPSSNSCMQPPLRVASPVTFFPNGRVQSGYVDENTIVNGVYYSRDSPIHFENPDR